MYNPLAFLKRFEDTVCQILFLKILLKFGSLIYQLTSLGKIASVIYFFLFS